ncbi:DUF2290 domain-containing protein [Desulforhopalus vacuolatus]|uniref:DUF2290 domain-containing protein n=1 Tax=Desulforhopalus vacuolatus TaxID=40414 RepID=UPI001966C5E3|nr:DUF2290 domain-containing protein [Desulforhopalus vacuolatus]MBM9518767.1 DUF2290 domain-containing protein [Desulforhopalus vacuolatus]
MITPEIVRNQMQRIAEELIFVSLSVDQTFPSKRIEGSETRIDFGKADISVALRNKPYKEIYNELSNAKSYNFKLIDGAIVQLMYRFEENELKNHRLAFFPSPYLEEYQNNPELYENDEIYADVIRKDIVPFPIRFDFDSRAEVVVDVEHPQSHLTLGQYLNCRIPVSAPLTPSLFILFILRNFYNMAFVKFSKQITLFNDSFDQTITGNERDLIHIQIP